MLMEKRQQLLTEDMERLEEKLRRREQQLKEQEEALQKKRELEEGAEGPPASGETAPRVPTEV